MLSQPLIYISHLCFCRSDAGDSRGAAKFRERAVAVAATADEAPGDEKLDPGVLGKDMV